MMKIAFNLLLLFSILSFDYIVCNNDNRVQKKVVRRRLERQSVNSSIPTLFTPLTIRGITFRNRICVSPMTMSGSEDGVATDFLLGHLQGFALGGAGMVVVEATAVSKQGLISPTDNGLWRDDHIEPLARIVRQIKKYGSVAGIQLNHAGRKGSCNVGWEGGDSIKEEDGGWPTIAPSALAFDKKQIWKVPKEATLEDIEDIKKQFAEAAKRAVKAGFDVIQLHFAHGYIIHQFMSPLTNKRNDKYGGSLQNRIRLGMEVAESVAKVIPDSVVLGARLTVTDHVPNGWDVPSAIEFAKALKKMGLDWIDCSGYSGLVPWDSTIKSDTYAVQLNASETIQKEVGMITSVIGGIMSPKYADDIVRKNTSSLVMLGRAFLDDPHWPYHAADALGVLKEDMFPKHYAYVIANQKFRNLVKNGGKK